MKDINSVKQACCLIIICAIGFSHSPFLEAQEGSNVEKENQESQDPPNKVEPVQLKTDTYRSSRRFQFQGLQTNLGPGVHGGYHFNNRYYSGLDIFTTNYSVNGLSASGGILRTRGILATDLASVRYFLFDSYGFYVQGGVAYRNWTVEATSTSKSGVEEYTIRLEFPPLASFFSIGGNWIHKWGVSGGLGAGIISGEAPTVTGSDQVGNLQNELDAEIDTIKNDFDSYANFPLVYANIGYTF